MKKFQYQVLQFYPDKVTGEFLNVGVVGFDMENQVLDFNIVSRVGAIGQLFNQANTRYLVKQLNTISLNLKKIQDTLATDSLAFHRYTSIEELTKMAFVRDDSALLFSDIRYSLDISVEHLVSYLGDRILTIGSLETDHEVKSDKEVWTKMFKQYFDKMEVSNYLTSRTIKTKYDSISFEHTWKNGHVNFFRSR